MAPQDLCQNLILVNKATHRAPGALTAPGASGLSAMGIPEASGGSRSCCGHWTRPPASFPKVDRVRELLPLRKPVSGRPAGQREVEPVTEFEVGVMPVRPAATEG